jgi:hypothetical protein
MHFLALLELRTHLPSVRSVLFLCSSPSRSGRSQTQRWQLLPQKGLQRISIRLFKLPSRDVTCGSICILENRENPWAEQTCRTLGVKLFDGQANSIFLKTVSLKDSFKHDFKVVRIYSTLTLRRRTQRE